MNFNISEELGVLMPMIGTIMSADIQEESVESYAPSSIFQHKN
jgi:hypothetical protein